VHRRLFTVRKDGIITKRTTISATVNRLLLIKSGNSCAVCKTVLADDSTNIAQIAHIYGVNPGSARYDGTKAKEYVNSEKNLICVCANCHSKIDKDIQKYSVANLLAIKDKHEGDVISSLSNDSAELSTAELEVLLKFLINLPDEPQGQIDYDLLAISEKIQKNQLAEVEHYITAVMPGIRQVEDYLQKNQDPLFADRLTRIFKKQFKGALNNEKNFVYVFYYLWEFIQKGHKSNDLKISPIKLSAVSLTILVYFFEKCEIFEK
jgi:hypothetical protein